MSNKTVHCHCANGCEKGHKGINAFIVEKGWKVLILVQRKENGIRGSDTLLFNDVKVQKKIE
jgi:alkylation response protein AidB-like acyl-CoA dehydrogenase